jgi:hypothetical protein
MEAWATKPGGKGRLRWSPTAGLASRRPRWPPELRPPPGTGLRRGRVADARRCRSPRRHTPWPAGGVGGRRRRGRSSRQRTQRVQLPSGDHPPETWIRSPLDRSHRRPSKRGATLHPPTDAPPGRSSRSRAWKRMRRPAELRRSQASYCTFFSAYLGRTRSPPSQVAYGRCPRGPGNAECPVEVEATFVEGMVRKSLVVWRAEVDRPETRESADRNVVSLQQPVRIAPRFGYVVQELGPVIIDHHVRMSCPLLVAECRQRQGRDRQVRSST